MFAFGLAIQTAGCVAKLDPLAIKEVEPGKPATLDPTLAAAAGNLNLTRNGKTRIPYPTGLNGGCVAAAVLLWLPLDVLAGGTLPGPDCDQYLPRLTLIQLESRRAAVLQVQKYGDFVVQLPAGTYLVAQVVDDKFIVPVRFGFQITKTDEAYDLGVIAVEDGSLPGASVTPHSDGAFAQLLTQLPASGSWPKSTALFTQISGAPNDRSAQIIFFDKKDLDAYLMAATLELKSKGMPLLSPAIPAASSVPQVASASGVVRGSPRPAPNAPVDVPFRIQVEGDDPVEGVGRLSDGEFVAHGQMRGGPFDITGELHGDEFSIVTSGFLCFGHDIHGQGRVAESGSGYLSSGKVSIMLIVPCAGTNNIKVATTFDLSD